MLGLPMAAQRDYYEVLGVARDATAEDLKRAYRKRAVELHPDRNPDDADAEDRFKEASAAYAVLSDADKRRRYDRMGHAAFTTAGSAGGSASDPPMDFGAMSEILEGLLGDVLRSGRAKKRTGEDVRLDVTVTFEEAALGAEKTLEVTRPALCAACTGTGAEPGSRVEPCAACGGRGEQRFQRGFFASTRPCEACRATGKRVEKPCTACKGAGATPKKEPLIVRVPPGVEDNSVRTVRGGGEPAMGGAGDLHVHVHIEPHPFFTREGADVLCAVPVSFPQAVLGAQLEIPTLEGKVKMKLPAGSPSGKVFRLRGKGIQTFGGVGKGDQLVRVVVEVPEPAQLSKNAQRLVEDLAKELGEAPSPEQRGFLDKLKGLFE
jgi:molecular chaperone DnaJ